LSENGHHQDGPNNKRHRGTDHLSHHKTSRPFDDGQGGKGFLGGNSLPFFHGIEIATGQHMLKLLGSYALAKLLGFGLVGAIVIYAILSLLT
jgi:hypothetical protein